MQAAVVNNILAGWNLIEADIAGDLEYQVGLVFLQGACSEGD